MVRRFPLVLLLTALVTQQCITEKSPQYPEETPNILWLVSEDNSAKTIGVYGNELVKTPTIDSLAGQGILFRNAFSNAPVCAIARATILSGMYAGTNGTQHMRSRITMPMNLESNFFPYLLKENGFYTTNNAKTDYNLTGDHSRFWSDSSPTADYINRADDQPFFAIFNFHESHESRMHIDLAQHETITSPEDIVLPPYHPETPHMKKSWAHYLDKVHEVDLWVSSQLKRLKDQGLDDNTIVFYYSDHGGVLPRSKRFMYDTGTRVPMIVHIPEKWRASLGLQKGQELETPVSFVDLAPSVLALAGIDVPTAYQGTSLFEPASKRSNWVYLYRDRMDEWFDAKRGVTNGRFRFIKNFMPHRPNGQHLTFLFKAQATQEWYEYWKSGKTNEIQSQFWEVVPGMEFFDTSNDPWEVNNLIGKSLDTETQRALLEAQKKVDELILEYRDGTFLPEDMFAYVVNKSEDDEIETVYDFFQSDQYLLEEALEIANKVIQNDVQNWDYFLQGIQHPDPVIRYWSAVGLASLSYHDVPLEVIPQKMIDQLQVEPFLSVKASLFESLNHLNAQIDAESRISDATLLEWIQNSVDTQEDIGLLYLLNGLHYADLPTSIQKELVDKMYQVAFDESYELTGPEDYSRRIAAYLYQIWS